MFHPCHWRDEAIAPTRDILDVPGLARTISKALPEVCNVNAEVGLFHKQAWPSSLAQLPLRNNLARILKQQMQNIECTPTQGEFDIVVHEDPLSREHSERTEFNRLVMAVKKHQDLFPHA
jgi:hypothetical protein